MRLGYVLHIRHDEQLQTVFFNNIAMDKIYIRSFKHHSRMFVSRWLFLLVKTKFEVESTVLFTVSAALFTAVNFYFSLYHQRPDIQHLQRLQSACIAGLLHSAAEQCELRCPHRIEDLCQLSARPKNLH